MISRVVTAANGIAITRITISATIRPTLSLDEKQADGKEALSLLIDTVCTGNAFVCICLNGISTKYTNELKDTFLRRVG